MKELSKSEEMILVAIWRLGSSAYGVSIRHRVKKDTGKNYSYGTLYGLLRQLAAKDLVRKRLEPPLPIQGGRAKTYFDLTPGGIQALKDALELHQRVWRDLSEYSFDRT